MVSVFDRLLRWGVFFSSVPFQSHSGNFRSSLPRPAGKRRKSISKNQGVFFVMTLLFLNCYIYLYLPFVFPEYTSSTVGCCSLFRGSLALVHSSSVTVGALQASPHLAAQSHLARRTRCAWVYESLGKVFHSQSNWLFTLTSVDKWILL